jgi:hypothetical protein
MNVTAGPPGSAIHVFLGVDARVNGLSLSAGCPVPGMTSTALSREFQHVEADMPIHQIYQSALV